MALPGGERILTIPLALLTQNWITMDSLRHQSALCIETHCKKFAMVKRRLDAVTF